MKGFVFLASASVALTMASNAMACGMTRERPYLSAAMPDRIRDDAIVAEVEMDMGARLSIQDKGIRFRVRRTIQGEQAEFLIVPWESCWGGTPGRLSGYIVAARVSRDGNALVVRPVLPESSMFSNLPVTAPGAR